MEQDGAYTRLMDWYYSNEQPIPHDQRYTIARAMTASERRSVDAILAQFFEKIPEKNGVVWTQYRIEKELLKARPAIEAARANGKKGGRPKQIKENQQVTGNSETQPDNPEPPESETQKKPNGFLLGSETETHRGTQNEPSSKAPHTPYPNTPDRTQQAPEISERATAGGRACLLMRQAGCINANPSHLDLLAALDEGVTGETLADTVREGLARDPPVTKPFNWAIATARGRHAAGAKTTSGGQNATSSSSGGSLVDDAANRLNEIAERNGLDLS
jgi:uncharacterized protein YdaU (DUF1376 family)